MQHYVIYDWQRQGQYEYETVYYSRANNHGYTGWVRCVGGRLADGRWPHFNIHTGATRHRHY